MTPHRIQLRRTKGWRKPHGAVVVSRPSRWGNPFVVCRVSSRGDDVWDVSRQWVVWDDYPLARLARFATRLEAAGFAVASYRLLAQTLPDVGQLRGHDLACWCPLEDDDGHRFPCHGDILLELANRDDS